MRDPESSFDYTGDVVARVEPGVPVSQTMVSRRSDLDSVQLWLRKDSPKALDADILIVTLYHANESSTPLASVTIPYRTLAKSYPVEVRFPSQPDPPNQSYLIRLETQGGPLAVYGRNENAYPEGDLSIGEVNQQADLAFRLSYKYGFSAVKEDLLRTLSGAWLTLPLMLLLLVPGCLAQWALGGDPSKSGWDWGQRFGLALGLSLGITPLVMIWTSASGLSWGQSGVRIGYICAAVALGLTVAWRLRGGWRLPKPDKIDLALLVIFLFALGLRLSTVRDLAVPAWVDPVHHTTIARLIVEQGAYPESYDPFVSATTASYHPGFHATVAALHWLTGLELDRAMLLLGQILNALIVPAIYLLTTSLTRSRKAGLFSALIAGFMTPMPAYYTSWGRYTQLAGLLALPAAAALMI